MHHVTYHLFRRWALLWVLAVLSVGRLSADQLVKLHWYASGSQDLPYFPTNFRMYILDVPDYDVALGTPVYFTGKIDSEGDSPAITLTTETALVWVQYYDPAEQQIGFSYVDGTSAGHWVDCSFAVGKTGDTPKTVSFAIDGFLSFKRQPTRDEDKTLWITTDTTLTADLYREGTDKIVAQMKNAVAPSGGGGSGGRNMSGDSVEDVHKVALDSLSAVDVSGDLSITGPGATMVNHVITALEAGRDAATSGFTSAMPISSGSLGYSPDVSGDADWMSIGLPSSFGGAYSNSTVDFNPFRSDRMGPLASWFRAAMVWLVLSLLAYFIFQQTKTFFIAASAAQQAKSNPIAGGTGAQATGLLAAALLTAAFTVFVTAILGWSFGDITIPALMTNVGTNPLSGAPSHIMWFIDQLFPIATVLSAFTARIMFPLYGQTVYGVFLIAVRWIIV